jgi:hypothetical protein
MINIAEFELLNYLTLVYFINRQLVKKSSCNLAGFPFTADATTLRQLMFLRFPPPQKRCRVENTQRTASPFPLFFIYLVFAGLG